MEYINNNTDNPSFLQVQINCFQDIIQGKKYLFQIGTYILKIEIEYVINFLESNITFNKKGESNVNILKNISNKNVSSINYNKSHSDDSNSMTETILKIKIDNALNKKSQVLNFSQNKKTISIGRLNTCDIVLEGTEISKYHCMIVFEEKSKKWLIIDGVDGKKSSNGIWNFIIFSSIDLDKKSFSKFRLDKNIFSISYE